MDLKPIEFQGNLLIFCICIDGTIQIFRMKPISAEAILIDFLKSINISEDHQGGIYLDIASTNEKIWIIASFEPNVVARICLDQNLGKIENKI